MFNTINVKANVSLLERGKTLLFCYFGGDCKRHTDLLRCVFADKVVL